MLLRLNGLQHGPQKDGYNHFDMCENGASEAAISGHVHWQTVCGVCI